MKSERAKTGGGARGQERRREKHAEQGGGLQEQWSRKGSEQEREREGKRKRDAQQLEEGRWAREGGGGKRGSRGSMCMSAFLCIAGKMAHPLHILFDPVVFESITSDGWNAWTARWVENSRSKNDSWWQLDVEPPTAASVATSAAASGTATPIPLCAALENGPLDEAPL